MTRRVPLPDRTGLAWNRVHDGFLMGSWLVERRLSQVGSRLKSLRAELGIIDEQLSHLGDDADDQAIRALADGTIKHRAHVVTEIAALELKQDELLDRM